MLKKDNTQIFKQSQEFNMLRNSRIENDEFHKKIREKFNKLEKSMSPNIVDPYSKARRNRLNGKNNNHSQVVTFDPKKLVS